MDFSQGFPETKYLYKQKNWLHFLSPARVIDELQNLEVKEDDIFVVTYPKSGTHWMQEIVHLILHDGKVDELTMDHRHLIMEAIDSTEVTPEAMAKGIPTFQLLAKQQSPRVFTTHLKIQMLPEQILTTKCRIIYMYRHPKDVITSWYIFNINVLKQMLPNEVELGPNSTDFETFFQNKLHGKCEYDSWFDHVADYDKIRNEANILYVSFEEMKADLKSVVEKVAQFIGRRLTNEEVASVVKHGDISAMKTNFLAAKTEIENKKIDISSFLHKGQTNNWKDYFTVRQSDTFDAVFRDKMKDRQMTKMYET